MPVYDAECSALLEDVRSGVRELANVDTDVGFSVNLHPVAWNIKQ